MTIGHDDQDHGKDHGHHPLVDRVAPQGGADRAVFEDLHRRRQRAGAQDDGQIGGLLLGEGAADLGTAAGDPLADHRRRVDGVVEDDGHALADTGGGDLVEALGADRVELDGHIRLVEAAVDAHLGIGEQIAGQAGLALDHHRRFGDRCRFA